MVARAGAGSIGAGGRAWIPPLIARRRARVQPALGEKRIPERVGGIHFVCRDDTNVVCHGDGTFDPAY